MTVLGWSYCRRPGADTHRRLGLLLQGTGQTPGCEQRLSRHFDPDTGKLLTAPKPISQPTAGRERAQCPDFSRDGKYLAYYVAPAPKPSPEGPRYGPGKIVIRTLETGQEREITLSPKLSTGAGTALAALGSRRALHPRFGVAPKQVAEASIRSTSKRGSSIRCLDAPPAIDWQLIGSPVILARPKDDTVGTENCLPTERRFSSSRPLGIRTSPRHADVRECRIVARDLETGQEREIYRNPDGVFGFSTTPSRRMGSMCLSAEGRRWRSSRPRAVSPANCSSSRTDPSTAWARAMTWTPDSRHAAVRENHGRKV